MKCPHCAETVEDNSTFCPFCGQALAQKYCAKCGGSMENKAPSSGKGFIIFCFVVFAGGLLWLQLAHPAQQAPLSTASALNVAPQKPYTIVSSVETDFAGHMMYSLEVRVSPFAKHAGIVVAARDITREKLLANPDALVDMRLYTTDAYLDKPEAFDARAVVVDFEKNPSYQLPGQGFEDEGEHLFIQWNP